VWCRWRGTERHREPAALFACGLSGGDVSVFLEPFAFGEQPSARSFNAGLPKRHGSCLLSTREIAMTTNDRRLILDHGFDSILETAIDALLREGLTIREVAAGR